MQISSAIQAAMNAQINHELGASYRYLAMSAWCTDHHLPGCASWAPHERPSAQTPATFALKSYDVARTAVTPSHSERRSRSNSTPCSLSGATRMTDGVFACNDVAGAFIERTVRSRPSQRQRFSVGADG